MSIISQLVNVFTSSNKTQWHNTALDNLQFLGLDLELTSLDTQKAHVTSVGWVSGYFNRIVMDSCEYALVRTNRPLGQSPVIHGLTDDMLECGEPILTLIDRLSNYMTTHVWVLHNAMLDLSVLDRVLKKYNIPGAEVTYVDTLQLAIHQLQKQHYVLPQHAATLFECRERLGLPEAPAHNALDDAMATLQLCFAQLNELGLKSASLLGDLAHTQGLNKRFIGVRA